MKVCQLIELLEEMPQNADVWIEVREDYINSYREAGTLKFENELPYPYSEYKHAVVFEV